MATSMDLNSVLINTDLIFKYTEKVSSLVKFIQDSYTSDDINNDDCLSYGYYSNNGY